MCCSQQHLVQEVKMPLSSQREDKMLTVSGKRKCSHCGEELGKETLIMISMTILASAKNNNINKI